MIGSLAEFIPI